MSLDGGVPEVGLKNRRQNHSVMSALKTVPLKETSSNTHIQEEDRDMGIKDNKPRRVRKSSRKHRPSSGFLSDCRTGNWMLEPSSSFKLLLFAVTYYLTQVSLVYLGIVSPTTPNYARWLLFLGGKQQDGTYGKHRGDMFFVAHQIIFWSCVRQTLTIHVFSPLARWFGIKGGKVDRFTEQGYSAFYWGTFGAAGLYVMYGLPIWYYKTEQFWLDYPHKYIPYGLKLFYLLQASYWSQQALLLAAGIEKPRKDFKVFVAHHFVTLYLIFWSYMTYFTPIGLAVFIHMDVSDFFFAIAKLTNYVDEVASRPVFALFVAVWTYSRHYLGMWILWSVWFQFDLIPYDERQIFDPLNDRWCAPWLRKQMWLPIFLLQVMNLFWYYLILRTLYRALFTSSLKDDRSDDEDSGEEEGVDGDTLVEGNEKVKILEGEKGI